jgi:hypothetical protein
MVKKHQTTMTKDAMILQTHTKPPMVAYKQLPNLKKVCCHAKLPTEQTRVARQLIGVKPCTAL